MIRTYAYLCNLEKCENCTFPTCSHTTDLRYRMPTEGTEMRLLGCSNGVEYYMEFVKKNEDTIDKINAIGNPYPIASKELKHILKGENNA